MSTAVDIRDVSAWYGQRQALGPVSLEMAAGEVTALIGPAGSGKTTLLRVLNRMHELVEGARVRGQVLLDDQDVYARDVDPTSVRRALGWVPRIPMPFPNMSVRHNIVAGLRMAGRRRRRDQDDVVESVLRQVGLWVRLEGRLGEKPAGLALADQQRLCIARALALHPEVLLMDDPCGLLDPGESLSIEDLVTDLKGEVTVIFATQDLRQAARVSDATAFLDVGATGTGTLVEFARTAQLFTRPAEERTEEYLTGRAG